MGWVYGSQSGVESLMSMLTVPLNAFATRSPPCPVVLTGSLASGHVLQFNEP
jgi:hypothetical protein